MQPSRTSWHNMGVLITIIILFGFIVCKSEKLKPANTETNSSPTTVLSNSTAPLADTNASLSHQAASHITENQTEIANPTNQPNNQEPQPNTSPPIQPDNNQPDKSPNEIIETTEPIDTALDADSLLEKADTAYTEKDYQSAFQYYSALIEKNRADTQVYARLGFIHHKVNGFIDPQAALDFYNKAIAAINDIPAQERPMYDWLYNLRGMVKHKPLGDFEGALRDYNQAILINPQNYEVLNNRGALNMLNLGNLEEAEQDLKAALQNHPSSNYDLALCNLGILYAQFKRDGDKALMYLNQAINVNPEFGEAYYFRGVVFADLRNNCSSAAEDLERAKMYLPDSYHARINKKIEDCS